MHRLSKRHGPACFLVVAFALAVGHLAWHALLGPAVVPEYRVEGDGTALTAADPAVRQIYLRRDIYLSQRPRRAWLQVLTRDHQRVFVNGQLVDEKVLDGFNVASVVDIDPYLKIGRNVIAIAASRTSLGSSPVVAVGGAYELSDGQHPIRADEQWRCHTVFERKADWWFMPDFDDRHWPIAQQVQREIAGHVIDPPRSVSAPTIGQWIAPARLSGKLVALRREFDVFGRPHAAWLRLTATSSYRLALNGMVIDEREDQLATSTPIAAVQRTYDLTSLVHGGKNVIALALTGTSGPPRLRADMEVEDAQGERQSLGSDGNWQELDGAPADWLEMNVADPAGWNACSVESGDLHSLPWQPRRETVEVQLPPGRYLRDVVEEAALTLILALATWLGCRIARRWLLSCSHGYGDGPLASDRVWVDAVVYLPLFPAALAIFGGVLAVYDPRIARQDVYRPLWLAIAALSPLVQWIALGLALRFAGNTTTATKLAAADLRHSESSSASGRRAPGVVTVAVLLVLLGIGFWLRVRNIGAESLHPDEWWNLKVARGFWERGFPSLRVHPDLPVSYASTYELMPICGPALATLVFNQDYLVIRLPSVIWSLLTMLLLFVAGRRMFSLAVGLVAAALFALAPVAIEMANFGRYYSQLAFFTLLVVYFFWLTIHGSGPLNRRALWLTVLSFAALYLTWEAAALVALGMMPAALLYRRGAIRPMLGDSHVWLGMLALLLLMGLQYSHRELQQSQRLWYGTGDSDVSIVPMWRYPIFEPWYYLWESSWNPDTILPIVGLLGAGFVALRHPFSKPTRYLLMIYLTALGTFGALLPLKLWRYSFWQCPLLILLASAALVAGARALSRLAARQNCPWPCRLYGRGVAGLAIVLFVAIGSGITLRLSDMDRFRSSGYRLGQIKFPQMRESVDYLRAHVQPGDVVIATLPHVVDHYWDQKTDYWLQTLLNLQAVLDDRRPLPLHKICGTVMAPNLETVDDIFARSGRVWYVAVPGFHGEINDPIVSDYLLQHMDVVYEDFGGLVMLRDNNHRAAKYRQENQKTQHEAKVKLLN